MKSSLKKASITLPAELEQGIKKIAKDENRTVSGVMQEAARYYLNIKGLESVQKMLSLKARKLGLTSEDDIDQLVHDIRNSN